MTQRPSGLTTTELAGTDDASRPPRGSCRWTSHSWTPAGAGPGQQVTVGAEGQGGEPSGCSRSTAGGKRVARGLTTRHAPQGNRSGVVPGEPNGTGCQDPAVGGERDRRVRTAAGMSVVEDPVLPGGNVPPGKEVFAGSGEPPSRTEGDRRRATDEADREPGQRLFRDIPDHHRTTSAPALTALGPEPGGEQGSVGG